MINFFHIVARYTDAIEKPQSNKPELSFNVIKLFYNISCCISSVTELQSVTLNILNECRG